MLFERINASGIGLVIGSIGTGDRVNNITFRDSYMYHTWKVRLRLITEQPLLVSLLTM